MEADAGFSDQAFTQTPAVRSLGKEKKKRKRRKKKKSETRMTASVLKQDPNT